MKILITGGAGFIGSHIVDKLIAENHNVVIIDNLSSGKKENVSDQARLINSDIKDFSKIEEIFSQEQPEIVYHLAAQIDVRRSVADPVSDAETNILASINLIRLSQKYGVKKFIFSSTGGAIYGETDTRPTTENHPEWPLSPYGISKLTIDKYLHYYHQVHGLKFISLRYANVYGPRQNAHGEAGVVAIFLNKLLAGEQPTINGDGLQTRDYVFVEDIASANILALENLEKIGVYNIGTGKETPVNDVFNLIKDCFDSIVSEPIHGPAKTGEQKTSCLDATKARLGLSWEPKTDLPSGIKKTFEWFSKNTQ